MISDNIFDNFEINIKRNNNTPLNRNLVLLLFVKIKSPGFWNSEYEDMLIFNINNSSGISNVIINSELDIFNKSEFEIGHDILRDPLLKFQTYSNFNSLIDEKYKNNIYLVNKNLEYKFGDSGSSRNLNIFAKLKIKKYKELLYNPSRFKKFILKWIEFFSWFLPFIYISRLIIEYILDNKVFYSKIVSNKK